MWARSQHLFEAGFAGFSAAWRLWRLDAAPQRDDAESLAQEAITLARSAAWNAHQAGIATDQD